MARQPRRPEGHDNKTREDDLRHYWLGAGLAAIVAPLLAAIVGAVATGIVTVLIVRSGVPIQVAGVSINKQSPGTHTTSATPTPTAPTTTGVSTCLSTTFQDTPPERVIQVVPRGDRTPMGPYNSDSGSLAGHYGVELVDATDQFIGALRVNWDPNGKQYTIEKGVDSTCQPATFFGLPSATASSAQTIDLQLGNRTIHFTLFGSDPLEVIAST
jgi:hypothetical protein